MQLDNIVVRYDGVHPSALTQMNIESTLQEILAESPVGGNVEATFTKKDQVIKGFVHLSSSAGPFFAIVTGVDMNQICHKLLGNMRRRLNKWKSKRMIHQSLKTIYSGQRQL